MPLAFTQEDFFIFYLDFIDRWRRVSLQWLDFNGLGLASKWCSRSTAFKDQF